MPTTDLNFVFNTETQKKIIDTCGVLADLLLRKNKDYGDSAFKPPVLAPTLSPLVAQRIRMSDKIERLSNLLSRENGPAVADESIIDTFLDLAGYCILQVIELKNQIRKDTDLQPTENWFALSFQEAYGSTNKVEKDPT